MCQGHSASSRRGRSALEGLLGGNMMRRARIEDKCGLLMLCCVLPRPQHQLEDGPRTPERSLGTNKMGRTRIEGNRGCYATGLCRSLPTIFWIVQAWKRPPSFPLNPSSLRHVAILL